MKMWMRLLSLAILGVGTAQAMVPKTKQEKRASQLKAEAVPGEFVVQMSKNGIQTMSAINANFARLGMMVKETISKTERLLLVKSNQAGILSTQGALSALESAPGVVFAEPNFIYRIQGDVNEVLPNDPKFSELWGMKNVGQKDTDGVAGKVGADIGATKAWAIATGSKDVIVAVIDTGVDYTHADIKDNAWTAADGTHGFNAITGALDPMDDHAHGTHCSGTIGGHGNDGVGVVGVNWNVSIMGVKFLSGSGSGTLADAVKAIDWATNHGARIMSNSWGGGGFSQALLDSITRASEKKILFIAAAGNDSSDNDASPSYPASYQVDNVIAVAASTNLDTIASFSNWGRTTVHLMAPGHNIVSSVKGGGYDSYSGTSMATPHVSGAAALLLSKEPSLTPAEVRDRLMKTSDKIKAYRTKIASSGRLNVYNMLTNTIPPGFITIPDSAWKAPIATLVESAHPYVDGGTQSWTIEHPGARFLRIKFSRFETEAGYDTLTLKSGAGDVIDAISGRLANDTWSMEVEGEKLVLEFKSDSSVNGWGFKIDSYSWTDYNGESHVEKVAISN